MLNALDGLAWQAAVRGETLRAVRLWGASASGQEALHVVYSQDERDLYDGAGDFFTNHIHLRLVAEIACE